MVLTIWQFATLAVFLVMAGIGLGVFIWLGKSAHPHRTRYRAMSLLVPVWIAFLAGAFLHGLWRPGGLNFNFALTLACGVLVAVLCLVVLIRSGRDGTTPNLATERIARPTFFWQGVLILFPVGCMAAIGVLLLRWDRASAEHDAREQSRVLAERLSTAAAVHLERRLRDAFAAADAAHLQTQIELGLLPGRRRLPEADARLLDHWNRQNPGFRTPELLLGQTLVLTRNGTLQIPPDHPPAPAPPPWVASLKPEQHAPWQEAQLALTVGNASAATEALRQFLSSSPPPPARLNAELIEAQLRAPALPLPEMLEEFTKFTGRADTLTEAGLPVAQLACLSALRHSPDRAGVSSNLLAAIIHAVRHQPSALVPSLLAEARRVSNPREPDAERAVQLLQHWWNAEERLRNLVAAAQTEAFPPPEPAMVQIEIEDGRFLLFTLTPAVQHTASGAGEPASPEPLIARILPRAFVVNALAQAFHESAISIPNYATAALQLGPMHLWFAPDGTGRSSGPPETMPMLGEGRTAVAPHSGAPLPIAARLYLSDPPRLYRRQQQRAWLFGSLIGISAAVALVGFVFARRAFHRQWRLNELKSNFVSSVSHELRAPIASVRLMAEGLERGRVTDPAKQLDYYRFIVQECRRLSSLIENVLDFSRIEQGRKQYDFEPTDLARLVSETVRAMEPYAAERGVHLACAGFGPESNEISGTPTPSLDARAVQQALVNLIDNAIKHSASGQSVTVGLELPAGNSPVPCVRVWVKDHGPGIPREEQERIFERFYRLGSELRREHQGVGIGLSIVKHIIDAHGGRIIVESEPGRGSRFTIELPLAPGGDAD